MKPTKITPAVQKLLDEAEKHLGKKVEFKDRNEDSQSNYRSNDFSDPENGIIFYNPDYDYSSSEGQKRIAHELIHIIYFHRDKVFHPIPWDFLEDEDKFLAERMAEFVEDIFVLNDLEKLGFGKDERYRERIKKLAELLDQGHDPASLNFPKAPESQQDLMAKQFAVICLMDSELMTEINLSILKLVVEAKFGEGSLDHFKGVAIGLTDILNRNENLKEKIQKAHKFSFTKFGIRDLVRLS